MLVDDGKRPVGQVHVQLGERAPAAANRVEGLALAQRRPLERLQPLVDLVREHAAAFLAEGIETQRAERQRQPLVDLAAGDPDEFERAAAEIADDTVGIGDSGDDAIGRAAGFGFAIDDLDGEAGFLRHAGDETPAVGGVAHGGGCNDADAVDGHRVAQAGEAGERDEGRVDRIG